MCPDFEGESAESRTFSSQASHCRVEFTFGDNLIPFCVFSAFLSMNDQLTRRADKRNPTEKPHLEQDKGIRLFNVALRWTHRSLRLSIRMALDISLLKNDYRSMSASFIVWSETRNIYLRKSKCFRHELVWTRPIDPECLSKHSPGALVAHFLCTCAHLFVSLCFLSVFFLQLVTWTDDPYRLNSSVSSRLMSDHMSFHCPSMQSHR